MNDTNRITRRSVLRGATATTALGLAAPMLNLGRSRVFAQSGREYSTRCIDLVAGSLVIDMLSPLAISRCSRSSGEK